jgi:hypothetical protein
VALVASLFASIAGIICGAIALSQIKRTGEQGRGLAIAGIVIGASTAAITFVVTLVFVLAAMCAAAADAWDPDRYDSYDYDTSDSYDSSGAGTTDAEDCLTLHDLGTDLTTVIPNVTSETPSERTAAIQKLHELEDRYADVAIFAADPNTEAAAASAEDALSEFIASVEVLGAARPLPAGELTGAPAERRDALVAALADAEAVCS